MMFSIETKGFNDVINITDRVSEMVQDSGKENSICLISCPGSTCGITTIEHEQGVVEDLKRALDIIAPMTKDYEHCKKWGDCNGYAHVRSALIQPFLSIPVKDNKLVLGTWQQVVFIDFDNKPRKRTINVNLI